MRVNPKGQKRKCGCKSQPKKGNKRGLDVRVNPYGQKKGLAVRVHRGKKVKKS